MTGGRRHARNRRQRNELIGIARAQEALIERALTLVSGGWEPHESDTTLIGEIDAHSKALAARVLGIAPV